MDVTQEMKLFEELSANDRVLGSMTKKLVWTLDKAIQDLGKTHPDGKLSPVAELMLNHVREMEEAMFELSKMNRDKWLSYYVMKGFDDVIE